MGLDGELGALVLWSLHTPLPPQLSQSLFERQGLPGPEKLPGSLRKGIPRTKSVGTAGLGAAWGWRTGLGVEWVPGWRPLSLPTLQLRSAVSLQVLPLPGGSPGISFVCGHIWGRGDVSPSPNQEILC